MHSHRWIVAKRSKEPAETGPGLKKKKSGRSSRPRSHLKELGKGREPLEIPTKPGMKRSRGVV